MYILFLFLYFLTLNKLKTLIGNCFIILDIQKDFNRFNSREFVNLIFFNIF